MPVRRTARDALLAALAAGAIVWFWQGVLRPVAVPVPVPAAQQAGERPAQRARGVSEPPRTPEVVFHRTEAGAPADFAVVPEQAEPVRSMLRAVSCRDLAALRGLYSTRIQERIQRIGWSTYVDDMTALMTHQFGGVDPAAYGYSFLGDGERGVVTLHRGYGMAKPAGLRVVREGNRWVLDEW